MVNFETPKIARNMHKNLRLRLRNTEKQWTFHERLQDFDIRSKTCALKISPTQLLSRAVQSRGGYLTHVWV